MGLQSPDPFLKLPTSGSYSYHVNWFPSAPLGNKGYATNTSVVTYMTGNKVSVDGHVYTYTTNQVYGLGTIKMLIVQVSGGWIVIADGDVDLSKYSFVMPSSTSQAYVSVTGPEGVGLIFRNWRDMAWDGACFLKGSMIKTPQGEIAVEKLNTGMEVCTFDALGRERTDRIISVTSEKIVNGDPLTGNTSQPVRILRNAFADNVPDKDLLVTEEHCIFVDGKFIPVRMLVNGISILYEEMEEYEYFHIEFATHRIILSNNLKTESYLRSKDSSQLSVSGSSDNALKSWDHDAAAPLDTSREFAETIFVRLLDRAKTLWNSEVPSPEFNQVTFVHLEDGKGNKFSPTRIVNDTYVFSVNSSDPDLYLMSSYARPSDLVGNFVDDRRHLGALVGQISVYGSNCLRHFDTHMTEEDDFGWHKKEETPYRWTNGMAILRNINNTAMSRYVVCIEIKDLLPMLTALAA